LLSHTILVLNAMALVVRPCVLLTVKCLDHTWLGALKMVAHAHVVMVRHVMAPAKYRSNLLCTTAYMVVVQFFEGAQPIRGIALSSNWRFIMSNSQEHGTFNLIGVYSVDGVAIKAKAQEISKITHFVETLDSKPNITIAVRKGYLLTTPKGSSMPTAIGVPVRKGTTYSYSQNGYYMDVLMKKMGATLTYTKEVEPECDEELIIKTRAEVDASKEMFITTYKPIAGWKCLMHVWDTNGFWDVQQTGMRGWNTEEEAIAEAHSWCISEQVPYVARTK